MRHRKKSEKFSRPRAQRKALIKSLLRAIIIYERITTTTSKAKFIKSKIDKLITWAKNDNLANKRLAYSVLGDHKLVKKLFNEIGPRFKEINGGYCRVLHSGKRLGDGASLSILEFTRIDKKKETVKVKKKESSNKPQQDKEKVSLKKETKFKEGKPKKGIFSGAKKIFKKEKKGS